MERTAIAFVEVRISEEALVLLAGGEAPVGLLSGSFVMGDEEGGGVEADGGSTSIGVDIFGYVGKMTENFSGM